MFDSFRKAEVRKISGPQTGPHGSAYEVTQGHSVRGEPFEATQYADADEAARRINDEVLAKNPRRMAVAYAVAATGFVAAVVTGGFAAITSAEHSAPEDPGVGTPVPAETRFITSTTTEFVTKTPKPEVVIKTKRVTVTPKPHHKTTNEISNPETPTSTYVPPQDIYTPPPPAPTHHAPQLTVRQLKEH